MSGNNNMGRGKRRLLLQKLNALMQNYKGVQYTMIPMRKGNMNNGVFGL